MYCAHEYTLGNLRFAAAVEPGNADIRGPSRPRAALRERDVTLPSDLGRERRINPFLRCREPRYGRSRGPGRPYLRGPPSVRAVRSWKDGFR